MTTVLWILSVMAFSFVMGWLAADHLEERLRLAAPEKPPRAAMPASAAHTPCFERLPQLSVTL